uniref:Putative UDP-sugar transporter protein SLC35A4 n=1 Tax=Magallana gigas TaxID=29159 RepID=K1PWB6_MAGGI
MLMWQTKGSLPQGVSLVSFLQYAVPGLLYSVSNNLSMMMQVYMDPTTFQVYIGIAMSVILKHASNITRLFVVSSSLSVTTILSVLVFGLHLNSFFFTSMGLLLLALYLFHGAR